MNEPNNQFNWITQSPNFQKWLHQDGTSILHVYNSSAISLVTEHIFQTLDAKAGTEYRYNAPHQPLYFKFQKHDVRFNTIKAMATTLIALIANHYALGFNSPQLAYHYNQVEFSRSWSSEDAFFFFNHFRTTMLVDANIMLVLDGLDQCEEATHWALKELVEAAERSGTSFKVIVTSEDDGGLRTILEGHPAIDLREHVKELEGTREGNVDDEWNSPFLPVSSHFPSLRPVLENLLSEAGEDSCLRRLVLEWLAFTKPRSRKAFLEKIQRLSPLSPETLVKLILDNISVERQSWARKVLLWVLHSARSLSVGELAAALSMDDLTVLSEDLLLDEVAYLNLADDILEVFGPLLVANHGEIQFSHPSLRGFFSKEHTQLGSDLPWYSLGERDACQRQITDSCLHFLSDEKVQKKTIAFNNQHLITPQRPSMFNDRSIFFSYAVRFWPDHYKLGYGSVSPGIQPSTNVVCFLENEEAVRNWARAKWYISNPLIRTDRWTLSSSSIIASLGLDHMVPGMIEDSKSLPGCNRDLWLALTEAARHGETNTVRLLLPIASADEFALQDIMRAAVTANSQTLLSSLISHATSQFQHFQYPPVLLSHLASLGLEDQLLTTLHSEIRLDPPAPTPDMSPLHFATLRNHTGIIKILLSHGALLSPHGVKGRTAVHIAARFGCAPALKELVKAPNVDLEEVDEFGRSPLHWACWFGHHGAIHILLSAGASIESIEPPKPNGWPPIIKCAVRNFTKSARALLQAGVDVNVHFAKGTALSGAAESGHLEMCCWLLDNGADPNSANPSRSMVSYAVDSKKLEIVTLLLERGAKIEADNSETDSSPLVLAAVSGLEEIAKLLLEKGADIDHPESTLATPLYLASSSGHLNMVRCLIEAGADLKKVTKLGWSPLHASYDRPEILRHLLAKGADINLESSDGTPLYLAVYNNSVDGVKALLEHNPKLEIKVHSEGFADDSFTPLMAAAWLGHTQIVRLLLEAGADINARTSSNETPLHIAMHKEKTMKVLLEYNSNIDLTDDSQNTPLNLLVKDTPISTISLLVNRGANLEIPNKFGCTPLSTAVLRNNVPAIKYLMSKKAALNILTGIFPGPLHIACQTRDLDVVKLLVEGGADVGLVQSQMGGSPLLSACYRSAEGSDDDNEGDESEKTEKHKIIRYLIEKARADVNTTGGFMGTPLNAACFRATPSIIKLLLANSAKVSQADSTGRLPLHFASLRTLSHIRPLLDAGADTCIKDKLGRVAFHVAVASGRVDVVEHFLNLPGSKAEDLINKRDADDWTPLMWAVRSCKAWNRAKVDQAGVVKLLLGTGADPWATGQGLEHEWTAVKLARYCDATDETINLLIEAMKERKKGARKWASRAGASRKARSTGWYCDACLMDICGVVYTCHTCPNFGYCFKCFRSKNTIHPDHDFLEEGTEFEENEDVGLVVSEVGEGGEVEPEKGGDDGGEENGGAGSEVDMEADGNETVATFSDDDNFSLGDTDEDVEDEGKGEGEAAGEVDKEEVNSSQGVEGEKEVDEERKNSLIKEGGSAGGNNSRTLRR
jgi:ankyrin repeat protein